MTTALTPAALEYARLLQRHGFTVYVHHNRGRGNWPSAGWFHYSRELNGGTFYGTVIVESHISYDTPRHTMPIEPDTVHGSGIVVAARSNGKDRPVDDLSVEVAEYTAMPQNLAEFFPGVSFHNAKPWGLGWGQNYEPLEPTEGGA